ncbi:MAG: GNAT family N-acetyltransferase [Boseongicola sp. SB0664_bin_43]|uniref:GNAT family N-acetyltransferase n=1 Tax=Boseongicola sp. SB0664_bin_43 TaxID=2604844 RepID=A0A6B0XW50_9RHOB|nr:GNAT family N-acetyltransferase [Boseongicola sp. SB0664_bin_43]
MRGTDSHRQFRDLGRSNEPDPIPVSRCPNKRARAAASPFRACGFTSAPPQGPLPEQLHVRVMTSRHEKPTPGPAMDIAHAFAANVPVIRTGRLVLRALRLEDFPGYASILCTDRGRFAGGPLSREDAWPDFAALSAGWMLHGHGGWAVAATATGDLLGFVLLGLEPGDVEIELGYLFLEDSEGKGFATEAAAAARDWGFNTLGLVTLVSYIASKNARSIALAKRLGAIEDTPKDWPKGNVVYRHAKPDGEPGKGSGSATRRPCDLGLQVTSGKESA